MKETMSCGGENYDLFFLTNQDGLKTFSVLGTFLKLHGDVEISASGRNFWGIYKVSDTEICKIRRSEYP